MAHVLIGLGANLGDRKEILSQALTSLRSKPLIAIESTSSFYESDAIGGPKNQPSFLNAVAVLETDLTPQQLLSHLQHVETSLGRKREEHWGARTIDLDILLYDDVRLAEPNLQIPHRWLPFRSFVLDPAVEIAAQWKHPELTCTLADLQENFYSSRPYCVMTGGTIRERGTLALELAKRYDAYLVMIASTQKVLTDEMPELFNNSTENTRVVDERTLTTRPMLFLDDYTQPDFKPEKNWHAYRLLQGQLIEQGRAASHKSLVPKARLRLCDKKECWQEQPMTPQRHWDYIRSVPVPTMKVAVENSVVDIESAEIVFAICCQPEQFRTRQIEN